MPTPPSPWQPVHLALHANTSVPVAAGLARAKEEFFEGHALYLGIDVGKSSHWAIGLDASGEIVINRRVENRTDDDDALVVVDQKNNIGSLVVRRCRARGVDVGYMPGRTMKQARDMFPGTAKNDRIDAEVIARTAMGMRRVVLPIADTDDLGASVSLLSSQLSYATRRATMARNRLHAVLLESDPAFEATVDLSSAWQISVMSEPGGAAGIAAAGKRRYRSMCGRRGARAGSRDALWDAAVVSARDGWHPDAEDALVRGLAAEIAAADSERAPGKHCRPTPEEHATPCQSLPNKRTRSAHRPEFWVSRQNQPDGRVRPSGPEGLPLTALPT